MVTGKRFYIQPVNPPNHPESLLDASPTPSPSQVIYDPRSGVRVTLDGVVVSEFDMEDKRYVRKASNFAELLEKQDHAPLHSPLETRIWTAVSRAGKLVSAPKTLVIETYHFYKLAETVKDRPEVKGKTLHYSDVRYVLAVMYVLALKRGYHDVAERIKKYPCGKKGEPCYVTKRKGDEKFRGHLSTVQRYYTTIYSSSSKRKIKDYVRYVGNALKFPPELVEEALKKLEEIRKAVGGRRASTIASVVYYLAGKSLYGEREALSISEIVRSYTNTTNTSFFSMLSAINSLLEDEEEED